MKSPPPALRSRPLPPRLEDLPNVGPAVAADFRRLGIGTPDEIRGRDPYMLYHDLCRATHSLHDPCMLDTFIAVVRYVDGGPAKPWWHYTAERKRHYRGAARKAAPRDAAPAPTPDAPALLTRTRDAGGSGAWGFGRPPSPSRGSGSGRTPSPRSC
ncbi:MAG TPA: helix-hairpin-helix domain-containing protein [Casimicrobiaceae bacterium]|jgi:hypothetical protein|nr:helix-hairpin-helix domain-containing protein [Casimicrobiaceae bacterium]